MFYKRYACLHVSQALHEYAFFTSFILSACFTCDKRFCIFYKHTACLFILQAMLHACVAGAMRIFSSFVCAVRRYPRLKVAISICVFYERYATPCMSKKRCMHQCVFCRRHKHLCMPCRRIRHYVFFKASRVSMRIMKPPHASLNVLRLHASNACLVCLIIICAYFALHTNV